MGMQDSVGMALGNDLPVVGLDDLLLQAIKKLAAGGTSALVVMRGDEVIGIVSESDLIHSINRGDDPASVKVAQVMTPCELITNKAAKSPCVQLDEDETVANALQIMEEAGIHHMLVSGSKGKIKGIATAQALLAQAVS